MYILIMMDDDNGLGENTLVLQPMNHLGYEGKK